MLIGEKDSFNGMTGKALSLTLYGDSEGAATINSIKDMLAGLPKFQEGKEAYSLHLTMTQDAMNVFQERRLADIASVEQASRTEVPQSLS